MKKTISKSSKASTSKRCAKKVEEKPVVELSPKKIEEPSHVVKAFSKAYAEIIDRICTWWIHDSDSGCDYDGTGKRETHKCDEGLTILYQPEKTDGMVERASVLLLIPKTLTITSKENEAMLEEVKKVNKMLLEDYNWMLNQCEGSWHEPLETPIDVSSILRTYHSFSKRNDHTWILKFSPCMVIHGPGTGSWYPPQIEKYIGKETDPEWVTEQIEAWKGRGYELPPAEIL